MFYASTWINVIEYGISIALISGSKNDDIKLLAKIQQDLFGVRSYTNVPIADFSICSSEWYFDLISFHHYFAGMYECLIHVEYDCFSVCFIKNLLYFYGNILVSGERALTAWSCFMNCL